MLNCCCRWNTGTPTRSMLKHYTCGRLVRSSRHHKCHVPGVCSQTSKHTTLRLNMIPAHDTHSCLSSSHRSRFLDIPWASLLDQPISALLVERVSIKPRRVVLSENSKSDQVPTPKVQLYTIIAITLLLIHTLCAPMPDIYSVDLPTTHLRKR